MTSEVSTILVVGGTGSRPTEYIEAIQKQYEVVNTRSGKQAISKGQQKQPGLIILNAESLRTNGERICRDLKNALPNVPIIHIHPGTSKEAQSEADMILFTPLSTRRLMKNINIMLNMSQDDIIECGPFHFNVPQKLLTIHGMEKKLTPKVAQLVELFLRHPGKLIDRKTIMEEVWQTDYLGDTRTLNVHIRWLRDAIEDDGKNPRYLQTVRGAGYRLIIPESKGV